MHRVLPAKPQCPPRAYILNQPKSWPDVSCLCSQTRSSPFWHSNTAGAVTSALGSDRPTRPAHLSSRHLVLSHLPSLLLDLQTSPQGTLANTDCGSLSAPRSGQVGIRELGWAETFYGSPRLAEQEAQSPAVASSQASPMEIFISENRQVIFSFLRCPLPGHTALDKNPRQGSEIVAKASGEPQTPRMVL